GRCPVDPRGPRAFRPGAVRAGGTWPRRRDCVLAAGREPSRRRHPAPEPRSRARSDHPHTARRRARRRKAPRRARVRGRPGRRAVRGGRRAARERARASRAQLGSLDDRRRHDEPVREPPPGDPRLAAGLDRDARRERGGQLHRRAPRSRRRVVDPRRALPSIRQAAPARPQGRPRDDHGRRRRRAGSRCGACGRPSRRGRARVSAEGLSAEGLSPYVRFSRDEWARLRASTPLTLSEGDLEQLRGINERISLEEVPDIYLALSRLLNLYVAASQNLHRVSDTFLGSPAAKVPYVIAVPGRGAVGKSTTARILQALLARWPDHPQVDLVTTDGFLFPNRVLDERGLMDRKGFPESYDLRRLVRFLADVKSGRPEVSAPV